MASVINREHKLLLADMLLLVTPASPEIKKLHQNKFHSIGARKIRSFRLVGEMNHLLLSFAYFPRHFRHMIFS